MAARAVKTALVELPKGSNALDVAYDQAMERINNQRQGLKALADQALTWIIFALRPLTVIELQHALAVELDDPELDEENLPDANERIASCAGLVVVDEESEVIRLVHYTTQEYFERVWECRSIECHTCIATICLAYLSFGDHAQVAAQIEDKRRVSTRPRTDAGPTFALWFGNYPLLKYSATYWTQHATGMSLESMKSTAVKFLLSPSRLNVASELLSWMHMGTRINTPSRVIALQFAAGFGSKELVEVLLNTGLAADAKGDRGLTPLQCATERGDEAICRLLLNRNDVDVNSISEESTSPLRLAASFGHDRIVKLLLAHPNIDVSGRSEYYTPLYSAAYHGNDGIVSMLLAHPDIDVNGRSQGCTPLYGAALHGNDGLVSMLLAHPDIEINAADQLGLTALDGAAQRGHDETVKLLLTNPSIDINAVDLRGFTPALWAL